MHSNDGQSPTSNSGDNAGIQPQLSFAEARSLVLRRLKDTIDYFVFPYDYSMFAIINTAKMERLCKGFQCLGFGKDSQGRGLFFADRHDSKGEFIWGTFEIGYYTRCEKSFGGFNPEVINSFCCGGEFIYEHVKEPKHYVGVHSQNIEFLSNMGNALRSWMRFIKDVHSYEALRMEMEGHPCWKGIPETALPPAAEIAAPRMQKRVLDIGAIRGKYSKSDLADTFGIPKNRRDAFGKSLDRWRRTQLDGWEKVENPKVRESRYLYSPSAVKQIIEKYLPR